MARNFVNYVTYSFSGGQNDTDEIDVLKPDQGVLVQNAYIRNPGAISKRNGLTLLGNDIGSNKILGGTGWQETDGTKWHLVMSGTSLYYLNSTTWTAIDSGFTTGLNTEFIEADGKLYILNGTDNIHSWDGASTTLNSSLTDLGASVPTAKYGVWWRNYMFICGGATLSSTTYPTRVYFSNLGDPDTWTTGTDYFDVGLNDGQEITGIKALDEFLIIFKTRSIYIITGSGPGDWKLSGTTNNVNNISGNVGCVSHRSIVQVGNDVWFMSDDGVRSVRRNEQGTTPLMGIVSGNLQGTIANMNKSQLSHTCATLYNDRVYFAFPTGTSTTNDKVIVADTTITTDNPYNPHPWVTYTGWSPSSFWVHMPSSQPQLYFGEDQADGLVYQAESGTSDNDVAIDFDYKGPMIDLQQPDMRKTTRFIIASGQSGGDYDVDVSISVDGQVYELAGQLNLSSGDLWNTGVWDTATWGYKAEKKEKYALGKASTQIQVRFRNNEADQPIKMYPYTLAIKPKKVK